MWSELGKHTYIGGNSNITARVNYGNFTAIAPYVQMHNLPQHASAYDHRVVPNFALSKLGEFPVPLATEKPITIGNDVWIGQGAILLNGVTIGDGAIIGSYAVVVKDIEPYAVVVGNPAKVIRYRFEPEQIEALLKIKWWDWDEETIKERIGDFKDIEVFIQQYGK